MESEEVVNQEKEYSKLKKENSYTYWVNNDPDFFKNEKIDTKPQKIGNPGIINNVGNKTNEQSAWNSLGTWYYYYLLKYLKEEKKLKIESVKEIIVKYLTGLKTKDQNFEICKVKSVTGESHIVLSRGKKRLGYHLQMNFKINGIGNYKNTKGTLKFKEYTDDDDIEYEINAEESNLKNVLLSSVKDSLNEIQENIKLALKNLLN